MAGLFATLSACSSGDDAKDKDSNGGSSNGGSSNGGSSSGGGSSLADCNACAAEKCPTESQACDKSETCKTLRACELKCAEGMSSCQTDCVAAASNDIAAVTAAAALVACVTLPCASACEPSSSSGGQTGQGGTGSGATGGASGSTSVGGASGSSASGGSGGGVGGTTSGAGGTSSNPAQCQDLLEWSTACVVGGDEPFRDCNTNPPSLCKTACYLDASCDDYDDAKAGAVNDLATCLTACDLANGGTASPTCANAKAKRLLCGDSADLACSDADPVDQCLNTCVLMYDCDEWEPPMGQPDTPFQNCYNACDASTGGTSPNFVVSAGGYVTTLSWHGYAWTSTDGTSGSTIDPPDFTDLPDGRQLCASGTVVGTSDYSAVAMLGFSLSQDPGDPDMDAPDPATWTPADTTGNGRIFYNVTNRGGTPLRIQIQGPNGDTDASERWCADIDAQSDSIFWHAFNTECWEGGNGTYYNGLDSLQSIMVLVPGDVTDRHFDFCIYEILQDL